MFEEARGREKGARQERRDRVRTLVLFSSSLQTDRTHKRFPKMPLLGDRISWGIFPESGAAQRSLRDGRTSTALKLFEKLEPPALINPLCLWTKELFFNLVRFFVHVGLFILLE